MRTTSDGFNLSLVYSEVIKHKLKKEEEESRNENSTVCNFALFAIQLSHSRLCYISSGGPHRSRIAFHQVVGNECLAPADFRGLPKVARYFRAGCCRGGDAATKCRCNAECGRYAAFAASAFGQCAFLYERNLSWARLFRVREFAAGM